VDFENGVSESPSRIRTMDWLAKENRQTYDATRLLIADVMALLPHVQDTDQLVESLASDRTDLLSSESHLIVNHVVELFKTGISMESSAFRHSSRIHGEPPPFLSFVDRYSLENLQWQEVVIEILDEDTILIKTRKIVTTRIHFSEFGLRDNRKTRTMEPNNLWNLLMDFGEIGGFVRRDPQVKVDVYRLGKHLRYFFGIDNKPFRITSERMNGNSIPVYETVFTLTDCRR
jgi:hypothetical protein